MDEQPKRRLPTRDELLRSKQQGQRPVQRPTPQQPASPSVPPQTIIIQQKGGWGFGKVLMVGCLGFVVISTLAIGGFCVVAGAAISGVASKVEQPKIDGQAVAKPADSKPALAQIGQTSETATWAVTLQKVDMAKELKNVLGTQQAQGIFAVLTYSVTNKSNQSTTFGFTGGPVMTTTDGKTTFKVSTEGESKLIGTDGPKRLDWTSQIQPGLGQQYRSVFDVNPSVKDYVFELGGNRFAVKIP